LLERNSRKAIEEITKLNKWRINCINTLSISLHKYSNFNKRKIERKEKERENMYLNIILSITRL